jgi:hypothetical protein
MKIHSNLRAGMTFAECDDQRNYMKRAAQTGNCSALNNNVWQPSYPNNLPSYPVQPSYPTNLPSYPPSYPPSQPVQGGGYYGGVWYADRSGTCG